MLTTMHFQFSILLNTYHQVMDVMEWAEPFQSDEPLVYSILILAFAKVMRPERKPESITLVYNLKLCSSCNWDYLQFPMVQHEILELS